MLRYSAMRSRPRRQANMRRCESPTASARSASASQPAALDIGSPCRRLAAAAARWSCATVGRPSAEAMRPVASKRQGLVGRGEFGQLPDAVLGVGE